jgi:deuterolysin
VTFLESQISFSGLRLYVSPSGLDESAFQTIAAGETVQKDFDIAKAHDVSIGGTFDIVSDGAISYAESDSTELVGIVPFASNVVSTQVDGAKAAETRRSYLQKMKRTAVQSDCTGTQRDSLLAAIQICATRASAAALAAQSNSAKITEYFKQDTATVRSTVSGVFQKIAAECANSTAGVSKQYCTDRARSCSGGVIAYTFPEQSYIVNCPGYFSQMVERTKTCHSDDKPFVTLHETTHLTQIKGTDDYGVYGYAAVKRLTAAQNLNHADTYALFANGEVVLFFTI